MKLLSFLFIPCNNPKILGQGEFCRVLEELDKEMPNGDTEHTIVIVLNCKTRQEIPALILQMTPVYLAQAPTDENVETATWLTWCSKLLMQMPDGRIPSEQKAESVRKACGIDTDRGEMLYLPAYADQWPLVVSSVQMIMLYSR